MENTYDLRINRRDLFVYGAGVTVVAHSEAAPEKAARMNPPTEHSSVLNYGVNLQVNGKPQRLELDSRTTLLDALRG
jgi:xanthine dehydrogenase YagT iron-sulfur-binding subunit